MTSVASKAGEASIVRAFSIHGLYGYRTLHLKSPHRASVLIARNGAGKTTLLAALNVFLRRQFHRLLDVEFSHLVCSFHNLDITLEKADLEPLRAFMSESSLAQIVENTKLPHHEILDFLLGEYNPSQPVRSFNQSDLGEYLLSSIRYETGQARIWFDRLLKEFNEYCPALMGLRVLVGEYVADHEIVYLPTYRRIELPLSTNKSSEYTVYPRRRAHMRRIELSQTGLHSSEINFGLSDISDRLAKLNAQIQAASNNGYRAISANIIKELLDGSFERVEHNPGALPDKAALTLFFDRLQGNGGRNLRSHFGDIVVPDLDQIYGAGANTETGRLFLQYFLAKLGAVIDTTRDVEIMVEQFVEHCNAYLSNGSSRIAAGDHPGVWFEASDAPEVDLEEKVLTLDRQSLGVQVLRSANKQRVPLEALSSGEKQIISLFARLYLYPEKMIVLIDEPELSLSLEWQQKILPDVLAAPKCAQMIAITHSPFVFENDLDPFAGPLIVEASHAEHYETDMEQFFDE